MLDVHLHLRLDQVAAARLDRLARSHGIGRQEVLRLLLARAAQEADSTASKALRDDSESGS